MCCPLLSYLTMCKTSRLIITAQSFVFHYILGKLPSPYMPAKVK